MKMSNKIRGEIYEIRCNKCGVPSDFSVCPHAYGDLQYCDCCNKCRALCTEMGEDMVNLPHECNVEREMTEALEALECICTTGYLCMYCRNRIELKRYGPSK